MYRSHYLRKPQPKGNVYKYAGKYSGTYPGECSKYDYYAGRWRDEAPESEKVEMLPETSTPNMEKGKEIVGAKEEGNGSDNNTDVEMEIDSDSELESEVEEEDPEEDPEEMFEEEAHAGIEIDEVEIEPEEEDEDIEEDPEEIWSEEEEEDNLAPATPPQRTPTRYQPSSSDEY